ncbi:MAG: anaerobic ribonucleoside-triphosphate reductase activating protein [Firmicutes bacterium]|nr:anaerobic ribonucleoside-triphosphate reductase activating protein [Bacillota bacterium]
MLKIMGFNKLSLIEYPCGLPSAVIFLGGCNFACPFCHNHSLIQTTLQSAVSESEILDYLNKRKNMIKAVVFGGGEPSIQIDDLIKFIGQIKQISDFKIKIDTNGFCPDRLNALIKFGVDYIAMDIKNSLQKYPLSVGINDFCTEKIEKSVKLLKQNKVDFEFRTTLVKQFHDILDIKKIGEWVGDVKNFYLQNFADNQGVLYSGLDPIESELLSKYLTALKKYIPNAKLR